MAYSFLQCYIAVIKSYITLTEEPLAFLIANMECLEHSRDGEVSTGVGKYLELISL